MVLVRMILQGQPAISLETESERATEQQRARVERNFLKGSFSRVGDFRDSGMRGG